MRSNDDKRVRGPVEHISRLLMLSLAGCALMPMSHAGILAKLTATLPDVPAPPQGEVQWVAASMRMNGLPMTLKTFQSRLDPDRVFDHYESLARRWGRSEFRRTTSGTHRLLAIRSAAYVITIEARETIGGCEGTITVSGMPEKAGAPGRTTFPHPSTVRIVSRQEYEDEGIEAEHLSFASSRTVVAEAEAFAAELLRAGWQILRQQSMQGRGRGVVIEAQHGSQQALVTVQPEENDRLATAVVVVWRKS
jgi:hypothetical protein